MNKNSKPKLPLRVRVLLVTVFLNNIFVSFMILNYFR